MSVIHDNTGYAFGSSNPFPTKMVDAGIMIPVEIQGRLQQTTQTHNAVSVPATTGVSTSAWIDSFGFTDLAVTFMNSASTNSQIDVQWSNDGATLQGAETILSVATTQYRASNTPIKARYFRINLLNTDASARTMSAWAYLKA